MKKLSHNMALAAFAAVVGLSFAGPTLGEEKGTGPIERLKQLLPEYQTQATSEAQPIDVSITLGATFTSTDNLHPAERGLSVTRFMDIDEEGAEIGRVAMVAPQKLDLIAGQAYRLTVVNASDSTHYVEAPEFEAESAITTDMTVDKGTFRSKERGAPGEAYEAAEIEMLPGATAVWEFVPQVAGVYKFGCAQPLHEMNGMKGEIVVTPEVAV